MALFVLQDGYRVVTTDSGGRVVHVRTGDALQLTPSELQLLARATTGGLDPQDPAVRPLVKKFAGLGVLVSVAAEPAAPVPEPAPEPPPADGPVPLFRGDLKVARTGGGAVFEVSDPAGGRSFALYDFELSVARMLDGRRTRDEIVAAASRLGIPCDGPSLQQFIRQLTRYGFLAPAGTAAAAPDGTGTWGPRQSWDESLRSLYQSGLKMFRQGRYAEAIAYFEAMLAQREENLEATEMLAESRQRLQAVLAVTTGALAPEPAPATGAQQPLLAPGSPVGGAGTAGAAIERPAPPREAALQRPSSHTGDPFIDLASSAAAGPLPGAGLPVSAEAPAPAPLPAAAAAPASARALVVEEVVLDLSPGPAGPAAAPAAAGDPLADGEAAVGDFAAGSASSPEAASSAALFPEPERQQPVRSRSRTLALFGLPVAVVGAAVVGSVLLGWLRLPWDPAAPAPAVPDDAAPIEAAPVEAAPVEAAPVEAAPVEAAPVEAAPVAPGAEAVPGPAVAAAAVPGPGAAPARPDTGEWRASELVKRGRVKMATLRAARPGVVHWEVEPEQEVGKKARLGELQLGRGAALPLVTLKAGLFVPRLEEGARAKPGAVLADIVYVEGFLQVTVPAPAPALTTGCEVVDEAGGRTAPCKIVKTAKHPGGFLVIVTAEPLWIDSATVAVRFAPP